MLCYTLFGVSEKQNERKRRIACSAFRLTFTAAAAAATAAAPAAAPAATAAAAVEETEFVSSLLHHC